MKKKFVSEAPFFSLNYSTTIELERYWCLGNFHGSSEFSRFFGWKPRKPRNSSYPPVTLFDIEVEASISVHVFPCHFTIRKSNKKSSVANQDIVDLDFLKKYVAKGHAECWTPKPAFKAGGTTPNPTAGWRNGRDFHLDFWSRQILEIREILRCTSQVEHTMSVKIQIDQHKMWKRPF